MCLGAVRPFQFFFFLSLVVFIFGVFGYRFSVSLPFLFLVFAFTHLLCFAYPYLLHCIRSASVLHYMFLSPITLRTFCWPLNILNINYTLRRVGNLLLKLWNSHIICFTRLVSSCTSLYVCLVSLLRACYQLHVKTL